VRHERERIAQNGVGSADATERVAISGRVLAAAETTWGRSKIRTLWLFTYRLGSDSEDV
jgi:hypothetical protein